MKEAVRHDTRPTTLSHMRADPEKRVADDRRMHGEADPAGEAVDDSAILHVGTEQAKLFARCFQPAHSLSPRSEEHTSELQSLMRISYAVFCLKKKNTNTISSTTHHNNTETITTTLHKPSPYKLYLISTLK